MEAAKQHLTNLQHAAELLHQAVLAGQAPDVQSLPGDVRHSLLVSVVAATVLLVLLVPRTRKLVLETAEAVLTIVLLIILICIVLGMPIGVLYMSYRGLLFLVTSVGGSLLAHVPPLQGLVDRVQQHVSAWLPGVLGAGSVAGGQGAKQDPGDPGTLGAAGIDGSN